MGRGVWQLYVHTCIRGGSASYHTPKLVTGDLLLKTRIITFHKMLGALLGILCMDEFLVSGTVQVLITPFMYVLYTVCSYYCLYLYTYMVSVPTYHN